MAVTDINDIPIVESFLAAASQTIFSFGFRVFGAQARQLEQRLRVLMAFELIAPKDWNDWLQALDEYLAWSRVDPKASSYPGQAE